MTNEAGLEFENVVTDADREAASEVVQLLCRTYAESKVMHAVTDERREAALEAAKSAMITVLDCNPPFYSAVISLGKDQSILDTIIVALQTPPVPAFEGLRQELNWATKTSGVCSGRFLVGEKVLEAARWVAEQNKKGDEK